MASPLEILNRNTQDRWKILTDVPVWEKDTVERWIENLLLTKSTDAWGHPAKATYQHHIIRSIEKANRLIVTDVTGLATTSGDALMSHVRGHLLRDTTEPVILFLELLIKWLRDEHRSDDYVEFGASSSTVQVILAMLEISLRNGSKWTIVYEKNAEAGLIERVSPQLIDAAKEVNNKHLDSAWNLAFGVTPDPKAAIEHAQMALESIASSNGLINATTGVYGALIGDIKTHKGGMYINSAKNEFDLNTVLTKAKEGTTDLNDVFAEWFSTGLDLIQKSNPLRHQSNATQGRTIGDNTGKQAVLIATALASLIEGGHFSRATKKIKE